MSNNSGDFLSRGIEITPPCLEINNNFNTLYVKGQIVTWKGDFLGVYLHFDVDEIKLPNVITFMTNVSTFGHTWYEAYINNIGFCDSDIHTIPTALTEHIDKYLKAYVRDENIKKIL